MTNENEERKTWEIVYGRYEGAQSEAVNLLSAELGKKTARDAGVYTLYVIPCYKDGVKIKKNAVVIGLYEESETVRKFVKKDEIPKNGYIVKVVENPEDDKYRIVVITAEDDVSLYFGAVDFIDDYCIRKHHSAVFPINDPFDKPLKTDVFSSRPKTEDRIVFTWGHPINDYRTFIVNMARQKLNTLIIWNDFVPVNAKEIIEFAHRFGIKVIWGFAWGWIDGCNNVTDISEKRLKELKNQVIEKFEKEYAELSPDGVYFQSFTERGDDEIGGRLIAEAVTEFVNDTAGELLARYPDLKIQFGLHATSVKNHLEYIAKVDKRVEIVWEDGASFPISYEPSDVNEEKFAETLEFFDTLINLRKEGKTAFLFKGYCTLDWERFAYQSGPFVMGENDKSLTEHDTALRVRRWKYLQGQWMQYGGYMQRAARYIEEKYGGKVGLGMAGMFDDGIWFPEAVTSSAIWDAQEEFEDNMRKTAAKPSVRMA